MSIADNVTIKDSVIASGCKIEADTDNLILGANHFFCGNKVEINAWFFLIFLISLKGQFENHIGLQQIFWIKDWNKSETNLQHSAEQLITSLERGRVKN